MARRALAARPERTTDAAEERGAQAIHRAMTVLEAFTTGRPSASLTEITEYAGLTVPTAHRMVRALQSRGYVTHDPITGQYSLGSAVMRLARVVLRRAEQDQLVALAMPHLESLRDLTGETVGLHTNIGGERVCVAEIASQHVVRMMSGVGHVYPLTAGAAGKALLCGMDPEKLNALLAKKSLVKETANTITDKVKLKREISEARINGYATSHGETTAGASAVAAPVFGPDGVAAAINIAGPASRFTAEAMKAAVPSLLETVGILSEHLGSQEHGLRPVAGE